jgi:hypothetical protein
MNILVQIFWCKSAQIFVGPVSLSRVYDLYGVHIFSFRSQFQFSKLFVPIYNPTSGTVPITSHLCQHLAPSVFNFSHFW